MRKMYWRPQRMSLQVMILLASLSALGLWAVEAFRLRERQPLYAEKRAAALLAKRAFNAVKVERLRRNIPIDPQVDPTRSGLIGELISPVTTNTGHLTAKQATANPNFAALVVELLRQAGVQAGDSVAVGFSGSFPALNVAVIAAVQTLKAQALIVSSAGASQWGANHPDFMWPDWEQVLLSRGILRYRSIAASLGGIEDQALGLTKKARKLIEASIHRNGVTLLDVSGYDDSLNKRIALYDEQAGPQGVRAYVNVGGGTTSVGRRAGKELFRPGLNRVLPRGQHVDSVMYRMARRGTPVIHLTRVQQLAAQYGLSTSPQTLNVIGEGRIFVREGYNPWLAAASLAAIVSLMVLFLRLDWGHRLFGRGGAADKGSTSPEPMV